MLLKAFAPVGVSGGGVGVAFFLSASRLRSCFGDESMVVGAVVAVRGRSLESPEAAALETVGTLSFISSSLMRDLSSTRSYLGAFL